MKYFVGVTDNDWYNFLSARVDEDVNFWQPGGRIGFKAIEPGAPFLFKLKAPLNAIGGLGFFSIHSFLPINMAWQVFGRRNGMPSWDAFRERIQAYRQHKNGLSANPVIGCIVLSDPIWFDQRDWIPIPDSFSKNIVVGKGYDTSTLDGKKLWEEVEDRLARLDYFERVSQTKQPIWINEPVHGYGKEVLVRARLGQAGFRLRLTEAYQRRCAVTGERTLPVLEAAHVKPFKDSGPHSISNGLLLRSDIHKLFDTGYVTVDKGHRLIVSNRIREEFENGRDYYQHHGKPLKVLPLDIDKRPGTNYVKWHNEHVFIG